MPKVNFIACRRGHAYADGNWAWRNDGTRVCLVCKQTREAQARRARGVRSRRFRTPRPLPFTYAMARTEPVADAGRVHIGAGMLVFA